MMRGIVWIGVLLVAGAVLAGCGGAAGARTAATARPATGLDLGTVPETVAADYHFAEAHQELLSHIPCYCGCGKTLGHRDLRDCFITRKGAYEPHASGCGICQVEAEDVKAMVISNTSPADIRAAIDQKYGPLGSPTNTK